MGRLRRPAPRRAPARRRRIDGEVVGWAALSPRTRAARATRRRRGAASTSADAARGRGVGRALIAELIASAGAGGHLDAPGRVFPENEASLALHERTGSATSDAERIAQLGGVWRDASCSSSASEPRNRLLRGRRAAEPLWSRARTAALSNRLLLGLRYSSSLRNTTQALCPPKPNELETATSRSASRASFGM